MEMTDLRTRARLYELKSDALSIENARLKELILGLAERVFGQSELLTKRAMKNG